MFKIILVSVLLVSCSIFKDDNYKRPLLNREQRESYISTYGWDAPTNQKLAFIEGQILPGMTTEYLLRIYGEPDLSIPCPKGQSICNLVWQYKTNDTNVVGSVLIKNSLIVKVSGQLADTCKF